MTRDRLAGCSVYAHRGRVAFTASDELEDWTTAARFWTSGESRPAAKELGEIILDALASCRIRATIDEDERKAEDARLLEALGVKKLREVYRHLGSVGVERSYGSRRVGVAPIVPLDGGWGYSAPEELADPTPEDLGVVVDRLLFRVDRI